MQKAPAGIERSGPDVGTRAGRGIRVLAVLSFYVALSGDSVRYTISWWAWAPLAFGLAVAGLILFLRGRPRGAKWHLPMGVVVFLPLTTLSLIWSDYRGVTLIGTLAQFATAASGIALASLLTWAEVLRCLSLAVRWVLGLSLVFEAFVALLIRHPILPFWVSYSGTIPDSYYWTRDLLLSGGPIQGVTGNRNILGFIALLGAILFATEWAGRRGRARLVPLVWFLVAIVCLALTRSGTIAVTLVAVVVVAAVVLLMRRLALRRRTLVYVALLVLVVAGAAGGVLFFGQISELLGHGSDGTGRLELWQKVWTLTEQRPWLGWGWTSYWAPWVEPFDGLFVRYGTTYLSAHDTWLDVWFQLGIVGLAAFLLLVVPTLVRVWFAAIDRPVGPAGERGPYSAAALFPLLVLTAYLVQSLTESRLIIEAGFLLLVLFATKTKGAETQAETWR